jgi:hypothetical protein
MNRALLFLVSTHLVLCAGMVHADTITITPYIDNTIYETAHNLSNGVGESIFAGTNAVWQPRRALLAFSLHDIPAGSQITSVQLELQLTKSARTDEDVVTLHRLTQLWGEALSDAGDGGIGENEGDGILADPGDATWSHAFYPSAEWTTVGGAFIAGASASASIGSVPASYVWGSTAQMVADVQGWLDAPQDNAGWILIGNESPNRTARVFSSKDHATESQWPRLTVEFTPGVPLETKSMGGVKASFEPRRP